MKVSPAKKFFWTYCTTLSTRGLSVGVRTLAASMTKAPRLRVLQEHVVEPGCGVLGFDDDRLHVVRNHHREDAAEVAPGRLEAADHLFGGLGERGPHELVTAEDGREDEPLAHAPLVTVDHESEPTEVHLEFGPRWWVVDPDRDRAPAGATSIDGEAGQRAGWDDDAVALRAGSRSWSTVRSCFTHAVICCSSSSSDRHASP